MKSAAYNCTPRKVPCTSKINVVTKPAICIHLQCLRAIFWCDLSIHQAKSTLLHCLSLFLPDRFSFLSTRDHMGMVPLVVQSGASATVMHVRPQINTAPNISTIPGRISRKLDSSSVILQEVLFQSGDSIKRKNEIREIRAGQMYHLVFR